jgi:hypothetical protein
MEDHPGYAQAIAEVRAKGYEVVYDGKAYVEVIEYVDGEGTVLRVRKVLHLQEGMRYLDLEHELGHIDQIEGMGGDMPPTRRILEEPGRPPRDISKTGGVFTTWQNAVTEYHNRLVEWLRLFDRGASQALLREHAGGVAEWRRTYQKHVPRSPTKSAWSSQHFPDLPTLEGRYTAAGGRGME